MKQLLEKLSRYWQLRFLIVGAGSILVVYAVVMPVHSNESQYRAIVTPPPALTKADSSHAAGRGKFSWSVEPPIWIGENLPVARQLEFASEAYREAAMPRDFSQSIRALETAARQDDPVAEFLLGHAYERGFGVRKDMAETARWFALAERSRSAESAVSASPADFPQALEIYRTAAENGDAAAQLYIGLAYDLGEDLPRSAVEAARWYRRAAEQGSSSAESNLGVLYHNGDGMPKDDAEAALWFERAAAKGSATAQYCLGRMYFEGDGKDKDDVQAAKWLERASQQGNAAAEVLLSRMYATADGVPGDVAKAYMWINLASASEDSARISRDMVEKDLSPTDIAEGQRLTHAWLEQHAEYAR